MDTAAPNDAAQTTDGMAESFQAMARNVPGALFRDVQWPDGRNAVQSMSPRCLDLWEIPAEDIVADAGRLWAMVDPQDLPDMDGYGLLAALKADPRLSTVPVLAVTSLGTAQDVARGRQAGFVDYLVKPGEMASLRAAVARALAGR